MIIIVVAPRWRHASSATQFSVHIMAPLLIVLLKAESLDLIDPVRRTILRAHT